MKHCPICNSEKELDAFYKDRSSKDGLACRCKECLKQYYLVNRERIKEYKKEWNLENRDRMLKLKAEYRKKNPEANKLWHKNNPERSKAIKKRTYEKNKLKIFRKFLLRKKVDINLRIKCNLRNRINKVIRRKVLNGEKDIARGGSAVRDLGCSIKFLKQYLESKFLPGMTWDNYSMNGWVIDHKICLASFDLTNREQFLKACHYTNLQPLWADVNIIKKDRVLSSEQLQELINNRSN